MSCNFVILYFLKLELFLYSARLVLALLFESIATLILKIVICFSVDIFDSIFQHKQIEKRTENIVENTTFHLFV